VRRAAVALAIAGAGIAGYLTYVHYAGIDSVCAIAHGCEKVQTSEWSELLGIPVALLGLLGYVAILLAVLRDGEAGRLAAVAFAWLGFAFSAYLTYREIWSIEAICIWCVASAVVLTLLAAVTTVRFLTAEVD